MSSDTIDLQDGKLRAQAELHGHRSRRPNEGSIQLHNDVSARPTDTVSSMDRRD